MPDTSQHLSIIEIAQKAINDELIELNKLSDYIDSSFESVVNLILNSEGRVVITGIGKSAIIAQKIVATLNSTGTPAIFMHAADAIHGDLGMIQKNDIVIAISKSGNTPEIKALCPLLKQFGNPLIALVGNIDSYLATSAQYIINSSVAFEACPNNLAPTTSTTAQLIMGDALAISLLKCRQFTSNDFSKYHPGGALGKRLYLTTGDIASLNLKPAVDKEASLKEVIVEISKNRLGATAVLNENELIGIITDGDIRRIIEITSDLNGISAKDIMTSNPLSIDYNELAVNAAFQMRNKKITQIIVTKESNYFGMVHLHDLNKEGIL
ncbi:MAG: KpsF/GutQ family sugar-phosphate isomerase [Bacteroidota bacterium]|nr:KpsF/GutQ family sugar-phosphate isomerase [Bacteroidota bacterium]